MTNNIDRISFKSSAENLSQVEEFLEQVSANHDVGPDVFGNILVAVTEAVNNAIYHGNASIRDKSVNLSYTYEESTKKLAFIVSDEGNGFDYNNLPDPTAPENITMVGGRGVFLIKQLADWVIFNDSGNSVELQFKL